MTNADKIRQMNDRQLARFLWTWKINSVTAFLANGGYGSMNARDIGDWVEQTDDTFVCTETYVGEEYIFDQDFNTKVDRKTENCSEIPNNCEHITEDGVTCAKYPACDDCLDNHLNKVKGSKRLLKGYHEKEDELQKDCNGCKFVGTYDTEFPCANCSRKTKDYYAKDEQTDCPWK